MKPSAKRHPSDYRAFSQAEIYTPARMASLAWVRSNFSENGPDILEARREGSKVIVAFAQETVMMNFKDELGAVRAMKELPPVTSCQNPFELAVEIDMDELSRMMNFGHAVEEPSITVFQAPAPL